MNKKYEDIELSLSYSSFKLADNMYKMNIFVFIIFLFNIVLHSFNFINNLIEHKTIFVLHLIISIVFIVFAFYYYNKVIKIGKEKYKMAKEQYYDSYKKIDYQGYITEQRKKKLKKLKHRWL